MEQILKENYSDTTFEIMINIKKIQTSYNNCKSFLLIESILDVSIYSRIKSNPHQANK